MLSFKIDSEQSILTLSVWGGGFFALTGLVWGMLAGSLAILFDAVYSLVSLGLSLLSLLALRLAQAPADTHFNFGRYLVEPLTIALKALVILLVCCVSLVLAVTSLLTGGREVAADIAMIFALVSVLGCLAVWSVMRRYLRDESSVLVEAESRQWLMDSVLSGAVLLGFAAAWLLDYLGYHAWAVYADPLMVVGASLYFMAVPVKMLRQAVAEVLMVTPGPKLRKQVYRLLAELDIHRSHCKMAKIGSHLMVEVEWPVESIHEIEGLVERIEAQLSELELEPMVRVNFHPADSDYWHADA
ncbi:cation diffusion facilitator family transporter [Marinospirillum sp. MEB164]|uniref:Cation diffusion facilitator family transporter n=1 Tax=Marinospirillum alkalitolerans TaxID=3123374 RepID=A0ABW8PX88_9GAMM